MPTIGQDLLKLKKLKDEESALKRRYEEKKRVRDEWERRCFERMENEEVDSHKTRGSQFVKSQTIYAKVQDRSAFVAWAQEHDPDLIQDKERAQEANALVRACLDDGRELPPGLGFYTRDSISVRKG